MPEYIEHGRIKSVKPDRAPKSKHSERLLIPAMGLCNQAMDLLADCKEEIEYAGSYTITCNAGGSIAHILNAACVLMDETPGFSYNSENGTVQYTNTKHTTNIQYFELNEGIEKLKHTFKSLSFTPCNVKKRGLTLFSAMAVNVDNDPTHVWKPSKLPSILRTHNGYRVNLSSVCPQDETERLAKMLDSLIYADKPHSGDDIKILCEDGNEVLYLSNRHISNICKSLGLTKTQQHDHILG